MSLLSRLAVNAAKAYGALARVGSPTSLSADYLIVAGGGAGGGISANSNAGGGGGAGGFRTSAGTSGGGASAEAKLTLSILNTYSIVVGAGGTGVAGALGNQGTASSISGTGLTTVTSVGGGGGGREGTAATTGGSGGGSGGGTAIPGASGTANQGYAGGNNTSGSNASGGGGGGGASAVGSNGNGSVGGNGGNGVASSISGSSVTYAGGGGGGVYNTGTAGSGGTGGGGAGGTGGGGINDGNPGTANTGGGGGGATGWSAATRTGGAGGSGIVIISYTSATPKFVGGTLTTSGGNQIHTFTSSGTLSPITPITASYLVVAGGGGGAGHSGASRGGGGGGAGGYLESTTTLYSGATYIVTVGAGGTGAGDDTSTNGSNSVLSGTGLTTLTSVGGGAGKLTANGATGGSGGGGGYTTNTGGSGTSGQGYAGGNGGTVTGSASDAGGGGGGAGGIGGNGSSSGGGTGGTGGAGVASSITGTSVSRAGGGGGGNGNGNGGTATAGGGTGGGTGGAGTPNSGGGGGGKGLGTGGNGGSGTVIISYAGSQAFNGGLVTSSGGNTIHTFTSTSALTPLTNNLNNSLRFRRSASGYLSRTPSVASNRTTWTWSGWVKRGALGISAPIFASTAVNNDTNWFAMKFTTSDTISVEVYSGNILVTTQVFRDPSAWYHITLAVDTTQATSSNRVKLYTNGNQVTAFSSSSYPSQNALYAINAAQSHVIGSYQPYAADNFDGYMTDINFIDGQALEPYYFGNNDANGVWKPILYKGTYGTNGFYLTFGNTTSTTTLGYDSSPNGNNWTTNNISLTAGTTYDAMTDVPTNTSATVANYAVLNLLKQGSAVTVSNGNLRAVGTGAAWGTVLSSIGMTSGKWYCEITVTANSNSQMFGICQETATLTTYVGASAVGYGYYAGGDKYNNGVNALYGASYTANDVIGIAYDADIGSLTFYKNNSSQGVAYSGLSTTATWFFAVSAYNTTNTNDINFGQRPFTYTPPSGFVALNTYNLPTPTILQGNKYMDATLYSGNAVGLTAVNQGQFKPDLVWVKDRTSVAQHVLTDSVRGTSAQLFSSLTNAEQSNSTYVTSFNSNGFTVGVGNSGTGVVNNTGDNFVGWQWQAGQGSSSSNTSGSITSTVSVNATAGFSVVTYTGTGANATVGHGLGVAPRMIIAKPRSAADNWRVYHAGVNGGVTPQNFQLVLNSTQAQTSASTIWNNTAPTSSVFSIGTDSGINGNGTTFVAYCWAEIAGFSKFGSYVGNSSTDGPFTYLGFRPKYILIKSTSSGYDWVIYDSATGAYNVVSNNLWANLSNAEYSNTASTGLLVDLVSNGFKIRGTNTEVNNSGLTYIYMAFAENPFKNSNAR